MPGAPIPLSHLASPVHSREGVRLLGRARQERGHALIVAMLCGWLACTLGLAYLLLAETETLRAKAWTERARAESAARDVVGLVASWFAAPTDDAWRRPAADEWSLEQRRGDLDGDGRHDAACDGSTPDGAWTGWPLGPWDPRARAAFACGDPETPDLVLEGGPWLEKLGSAFGDDVVVERVVIHAAPLVEGRRTGALAIVATVAIERGTLRVARSTVRGLVHHLPALRGEEVLAAGGHVTVERGAHVRWGVIAAEGDVSLPRPGEDGHPASGLPRQHDLQPVPWAPGGATDWHYPTHEREYVLTELLGRTVQGERVPEPPFEPARIEDPWRAVRAGGVVLLGGDHLGKPGERQPYPYDPRRGPLADDLSHLTMARPRLDPLCDGRARALLQLARPSGGAAQVRRFVLGDEAPGSEPLWRENGTGVLRTASEWLAELGNEPALIVFARGERPAPRGVRLGPFRGMLLVEARRVTLAAAGAPRREAVLMPGEPFQDAGVDLDHDGVPEPGTAGNGRWDSDLDDDGVLDEEPVPTWLLDGMQGQSYLVPYDDHDPALLESRPHEAFLNFDYPADAADPATRVVFSAGLGEDARPVRDLDGDGVLQRGVDAFTTMGRDAEGARLEVPLHGRGLVVNLEGDVVVAEGFVLHGAVRAAGDVKVESGAQVLFDAGLATTGRPTDLDVPRALLADVAWARRAVPRPGAGPANGPGAASDGDGDDDGDDDDASGPSGRGGSSPQPGEGGGRGRGGGGSGDGPSRKR